MREIDHIIIHCAATKANQKVDAVIIDGWHRARGWFGNGYHYIITREGHLESQASGQRCRPLAKAGAHIGDCGTGWNGRSIGICLAGGIDAKGNAEDNFTPEQYNTLTNLLALLKLTFPAAAIKGHRDLIEETGASPKDCPSFSVENFLIDRKI